MRRKAGAVLPLEVAVLETAIALHMRGTAEFYGYLLASAMREGGQSKTLTAHGTLYKALDRMEKAGLVESRWEDPQVAASDERPRRRLYGVTAAGEAALATAVAARPTGTAEIARAAPA